jgi:hypothetical protein
MKLDYTDPLTDKVTLETGAQYALERCGERTTRCRNLIDGDVRAGPGPDQRFPVTTRRCSACTAPGRMKAGSGRASSWGCAWRHTDLRTLARHHEREATTGFSRTCSPAPTPRTRSPSSSRCRPAIRGGYDRPELWDLNPFFNITNNFNIRTGNPDLQPEYTDSFEFTSILIVKKASLNASVYHLYTTDVVERISTLRGQREHDHSAEHRDQRLHRLRVQRQVRPVTSGSR